MTIEFKVKASKAFCTVPDWLSDPWAGKQYVTLPEHFERHADKQAARIDARFSAYANSDLFASILKRHLRDNGIARLIGERWCIALDNPSISVDSTGFLSVVTVTV